MMTTTPKLVQLILQQHYYYNKMWQRSHQIQSYKHVSPLGHTKNNDTLIRS